MAARDRVADGADPEAARLASIKEFGNVTLTADASRQVWTSRWLEAARQLVSDVRYAFRVLAKSPGFAFIVVAVLTLGIGLNAAVFTLFKGLALKPLAGVEGSSSLGVVLARTNTGRQVTLSYPDYKYLRDHDRAFAGLAGSSLSTFSLGLGNSGERVWGEFVTGNYFQLLGVRAQLGRVLLPSDEVAPGQHPVRRAQRRPVAPRLQRRPEHRRQDDPPQRVSPDRRRRRGCRRSTARWSASTSRRSSR